MLLIPELEAVLILVPRTGSGSLCKAITKRYPQSKLLYRHMEACGVPRGYDRWQKIGIVRHPLDRLWSLYKFMRMYDNDEEDSAYSQSLNDSTELPFSNWIVENQIVFTSPYDRSGHGHYYAQYTTNHPIPENQKSQFLYLRPDLGTKIFQFKDLVLMGKWLDIDLSHENKTCQPPMPRITQAAEEYVKRVFAWDLDQTERE